MTDVDAAVLVVDAAPKFKLEAGELPPAELELIDALKKRKLPAILAINKIDLIENKEELMGRIMEMMQEYNFEAVVPVSAAKNDGIDELLSELMNLAFPSEHFFPDDTLTDQPERVIASEIIREKMLRLLDKEIPHGVAVSIEKMRERTNTDLMDVEATIYCEKESHKGIIIGKQGATLKRISTYARQDMEKFFGCRINLQCWVKVKEDWRNREGLIHNFGLD
jgi:GTP-binding protein Era